MKFAVLTYWKQDWMVWGSCEVVPHRSHTYSFYVCWPCISIYLRNKNQLDVIFILSLFRQSTSTCFGHICSPSSGGMLYMYNMYQLLYIYSIPPDDGLKICPKHVEVDWRNKLRINIASSWFSLHRYLQFLQYSWHRDVPSTIRVFRVAFLKTWKILEILNITLSIVLYRWAMSWLGGGSGTIPGQSVRVLWWPEWELLSEYVSFSLAVSFHQFSIHFFQDAIKM